MGKILHRQTGRRLFEAFQDSRRRRPLDFSLLRVSVKLCHGQTRIAVECGYEPPECLGLSFLSLPLRCGLCSWSAMVVAV